MNGETTDPRWAGEGIPYARERDRRGHRVHVALACVYLLGAGIATSTESLAFPLLTGFALLRCWVLWRCWVRVLCYPVVWALLAWLAWWSLTLLWTPDLAAGLDSLGGARCLLLLFALFPVSDRWRPLVTAYLVGLSAQVLLQFGQSAGIMAPDLSNPIRHAGVFSHPGYLSTHHAIAFVLALSWLTRVGRRPAALLLLGAMALSLAGMGIAAGRGAILALMAGAPLTSVLALRGVLPWRRVAAVTAGVALCTALLIGGLPLLFGAPGMTAKVGELRTVTKSDTPTGLRLLYWSASWDAIVTRPVAGFGAGGTHAALADNPRLKRAVEEHAGRSQEFFETTQPHSVYLQTLLEQGAIGALLLACVLATAGRLAFRRVADLPIGAGLVGALTIWALSAGFDALHMAGRMASMGCVLIALSMGGAAARSAWSWPERLVRRWTDRPWANRRLAERHRAASRVAFDALLSCPRHEP